MSELQPVKCHRCNDTREVCEERAVCIIGKVATNHVDKDGALWTWLPQVGGYVSPCRVVSCNIHAGADACFDVDVYHDGEFPTDHPEVTLHICAHEQLTRFAERVAKHLAEVEFVGPPEPPPAKTSTMRLIIASAVAKDVSEMMDAAPDPPPARTTLREIEKNLRPGLAFLRHRNDRPRLYNAEELQPTVPAEFVSIKLEVGDALRDELAELEGDDGLAEALRERARLDPEAPDAIVLTKQMVRDAAHGDHWREPPLAEPQDVSRGHTDHEGKRWCCERFYETKWTRRPLHDPGCADA